MCSSDLEDHDPEWIGDECSKALSRFGGRVAGRPERSSPFVGEFDPESRRKFAEEVEIGRCGLADRFHAQPASCSMRPRIVRRPRWAVS